MSYSLVDLGEDFTPWNLNRNEDVLMQSFSNQPVRVRLRDGVVVELPAEFVDGIGISDNGLVLGWQASGVGAWYHIGSGQVEPIAVPGFAYTVPSAINRHGDVAGTVRQGLSLLDSQQGFILRHASKAVTLIPPTLPSPLPGSTANVELRDLNDNAQAIGSQRWQQGLNQLMQPIWFDGAVLQAIGRPAFLDNGSIITNDGRMRLWYDTGGDAIYDAATNMLTPFNGVIRDMRSGGRILWQDNWPSDIYHLTTPTGTTPLVDLFPAGSGFTAPAGIRMNEAGTIVGAGRKNGAFHGFMLVPPRPVFDLSRLDTIVAHILFGVINDAGGVIVVDGHIIRVPPRDSKTILSAIPPLLAQRLAPLLDARPGDAEAAAALRWRLAHEIARYRAEFR
jgi:hypothetical protein